MNLGFLLRGLGVNMLIQLSLPLFYSIKSRVQGNNRRLNVAEMFYRKLTAGVYMAARTDEIHCAVVFDWKILRAEIRRNRNAIRHQTDDDVSYTEPCRGGHGGLRP